jgi:transcriptional regulator with XRE-family HTH domain
VDSALKDLRVRIGHRIKEFREGAGLAQWDLADELNDLGYSFNQSAIAKLESGHRTLRIDEGDALAKILKVDMSAFLEVTDYVEVNNVEAHRSKALAEIARIQGEIAWLEGQLNYQQKVVESTDRRLERLAG